MAGLRCHDICVSRPPAYGWMTQPPLKIPLYLCPIAADPTHLCLCVLNLFQINQSSASVSCQKQDVFPYLGNEMSNADSKLWWLSNIRGCFKLRWTVYPPSLTFCVWWNFTAVQIRIDDGGVYLLGPRISWNIILPTVFDQRSKARAWNSS